MGSDAAGQTPDPGTGTHADESEQGFWSNDNENAKVTYTANGEDGSALFPKPVIQVPEPTTGNLIIDKVVEGLGDTSLPEGQQYTFTVTAMDENAGLTGEFGNVEFVNGNATVTVDGDGQTKIEGLPAGAYTISEVTENMPDIGDYHFSHVVYVKGQENQVIAKVTAGEDITVTVQNWYEHNDQTLTVRKFVTGNMGNTEEPFKFTLTLTNSDGSEYKDKIENDKLTPVSGKDNQYTFTLKNGETLDIVLPYGVQAKVEETTSEYTVSYRCFDSSMLVTEPGNAPELPAFTDFADGEESSISVGMDRDRTMDFQNKLEIVTPPTGLNNNNTPYRLMLTLSAFAGLALVGGLLAQRRRVRRER